MTAAMKCGMVQAAEQTFLASATLADVDAVKAFVESTRPKGPTCTNCGGVMQLRGSEYYFCDCGSCRARS